MKLTVLVALLLLVVAGGGTSKKTKLTAETNENI